MKVVRSCIKVLHLRGTAYSLASLEKSKHDALHDLTRLDEKMRERLKWSDTKHGQSNPVPLPVMKMIILLRTAA